MNWMLRLANRLVRTALMLLWPLAWSALAMPVVQPGNGAQDAIAHAHLLEDPTAALTLAQAQQAFAQGKFTSTADSKDALALGFTRSAFWLRLELSNATPEAARQMLEVVNARISYVTLYAPGPDGRYVETATGSDMPFATRAHENRHFVFPLQVPAQTSLTLYVRAQSTIGLILPVRLWAHADFEHHERHDYMVQAMYFGVALAMALFNLMLLVALRDRAYALYVCFVAFSVLAVGQKTGMASEFLWPQHLTWTNPNYYMATSWGLLCFMAFMRSMLGTAQHLPRIDLGLRAGMVLHALMPVLYWTVVQSVARFTIWLFVVSCVLLLGVVAWCIFRRMRAAYFFGGAFAVLMAGSLMTLLRALGILPTNVLTVDGLQAGSTLEMLLLAFALADRFIQMRREKLKAQRDLVLAKQKLVETLQASERELAQRVDDRTSELQALNEKLEALSMVDGLTGIANRRQFDQELHKAWARLERLGQPLALVMLDVDLFKRYNDHYGHQAGDECLRKVAQAMASVGRATDVVARYGGEEFVMVAPASDGPSALLLAQRACQAVQALGEAHAQSPFGVVTVSCGAASVVPGVGVTPQDLLRLADAALYQAKARGRNQAVLADS